MNFKTLCLTFAVAVCLAGCLRATVSDTSSRAGEGSSSSAGDLSIDASYGIAVDQNGVVYTVHSTESRNTKYLQKSDSSGRLLSIMDFSKYIPGLPTMCTTDTVAADRFGNMYIGDIYGRVLKFDSAGKFLRNIDLDYKDDLSIEDRYDFADSMAIDLSGNIYVMFRPVGERPVLRKYDAKGRFVRNFGEHLPKGVRIVEPIGYTADSAGNVYVADTDSAFVGDSYVLNTERRRAGVHKLDPSGRWITKLSVSKHAKGPGTSTPEALAVGENDTLYVLCAREFLDTSNLLHQHTEVVGSIQVFSSAGEYIRTVPLSEGDTPGGINLIAVDKTGNIYTLNEYLEQIRKRDPSGKLLAEWNMKK